ncbi:hypothetical protein IT575_05950 [bacterium]|nr:hypothetical protein [bacterium]
MPMPSWDVPFSEEAAQHESAVDAYVNNQARIKQLCDGLRPLDDPDNPYRGLYAPIDLWAYERLKGLTSEPYKLYLHLTYSNGGEPFEVPEGWRVTIKTISPEGFLIPQFINGIRDEYRFDRPTVGETLGLDMLSAEDWGGQPMDWIAIVAPLDWDALELDSAVRLSDFIEALDFPRVPAWLAQSPPVECIFVPNGDILCYGELGKKYMGGPYYSVEGERWYRYDRQGRLLGTLDPPNTDFYSNWRLFYWPGMARLEAEAVATDCWLSSRSCYSTIKELSVKGEEVRTLIFDYDGSPVDPETPYDHSRSNMGWPLDPDQLKDMFEAQVQLGLVDPDLPSPHEGRSDGPQRFSGEPVLPRLVIERQSIMNTRENRLHCIARPPADPANPYSAQYEALDWYLAELALLESMTQLVELKDGQYSAYAEAVKALNARLGYAPPDPPLPIKFEQPWQISQSGSYQSQDNATQFPQVQFSQEGFMLPTKEMYRQALLFPGNADLRPYELPYIQPRTADSYDTLTGQRFLGGITLSAPLPAKLQARYAELAREADLHLALPLPAWALARDFYAWLQVPNGELVLLCGTALNPHWINYAFELETVSRTGSMGPYFYIPAIGDCLEGMRFERWSADGRLLASADAKSTLLWQSLYWPGLGELIAAADSNSKQRQDFFLRNRAGFLLQYQNDREHYDDSLPPALLAAFDFDGSALDITQPVKRDDSSCRWFMKPGVEPFEVQIEAPSSSGQPWQAGPQGPAGAVLGR